jgi:hypothetical protein
VTDAGEREAGRGGPVVAGSYREADPPDSLEADQPPEGVALRWSPAGNFTAYHVFRRGNRGPWARVNAAPVVVFSADGPTTTQAPWFYRDTTAVAGDTLGYAVAGVDPFARVSRRSAEVRLVVRDVAPPARPLSPPGCRAYGGHLWVRRPTRASCRIASGGPRAARVRSSRQGPAGLGPGGADEAGPPVASGGIRSRPRTATTSDPSFSPWPSCATWPRPPPAGSAPANTRRIALAWQPVATADLRGYRVYRASAATGTFGLLTATPSPAPGFTDSIPRGADHAFHYRVTAVDSAFNESAASPVLAARPPDTRPPSAPRIESVRPGEDCLVVRWLPNPERDVTAYRVRYRARGDSAWSGTSRRRSRPP